MSRLYIDCRAGMSGDLFLAALSRLGLDLAPLEAMLRRSGLTVRLETREENREAGRGASVRVIQEESPPCGPFPDLPALAEGLCCPQKVRFQAANALRLLAEAEAHACGCPVNGAFSAAGAVDALVEVVGALWGLDALGVRQVDAAPLPWFSGVADRGRCRVRLPAPAVLTLMRGMPVFPTDAEEELVTPVGALLYRTLLARDAAGAGACAGPAGRLLAWGTGYDSRCAARSLRLVLLEEADAPGVSGDEPGRPRSRASLGMQAAVEDICVLETHLDHLTGEELGHALEAVMADGALDVLWLPGIMKKGRPGGVLRVLCRVQDEEATAAAIFRHTHTLGLRRQVMERVVLERGQGVCSVEKAQVPAKTYALEGRDYLRPEHDRLSEIARADGVGVVALRLARWKAPD